MSPDFLKECPFDSDDENPEANKLQFIYKLETQIQHLQQRLHIMEQSAKTDKSQISNLEDCRKRVNPKIDRKVKILLETRYRQQNVDLYQQNIDNKLKNLRLLTDKVNRVS